MASLLEIGGVAPNNITVDSEDVKVVTYGDHWAVWAKFDDPSTQPIVNPLQPYQYTSVSGFSLWYIPTNKNPNTYRASSNIVFDMMRYSLDIKAYIERWMPPDTSRVNTTWSFKVELKDSGGNVVETLLTPESYSYNMSEIIAPTNVFYLNVGINDTASSGEFKPYFEFKYQSSVLKRVEASYLAMDKATYLNGYPKITSSGASALDSVGTVDMQIAYIHKN